MSSLSRRRFLVGCGQTLASLTLAGAARRASARSARAVIETTDLGGGLKLLTGAGCNVVAMPGPDGALLVDGGLAEHSGKLLSAATHATRARRVHTLINTHWHPEQTGSNERVGRSGGTIFSHEKTRLWLGRASPLTGTELTYGPLPISARPTQTTRGDGSLDFGGRRVDYGYLPQAHTDGDLYVHFREQDVLVTGGPFAGNGWPLLDIRNGAWIGGTMRAFEKLSAVVGSATRVVSANGAALASRADIERQRDMYTAVYNRLMDELNKGMGPDDVVAKRIAQDFEPAMGDASTFLNLAFRSLALAYAPD
jgi:glyoxylase-like metal-dependent hydrolase (beta-lactamase superfamily II)